MKYNHILEVHAKEWFDKVNGNSYFSAQVYFDDELVASLPFQYGYGEHYQDIALQELKKNGLVKNAVNGGSLWSFCDNNNIKLIAVKHEGCKKKELL